MRDDQLIDVHDEYGNDENVVTLAKMCAVYLWHAFTSEHL